MWYTALLSVYAKSSPERPATSLYTWKSVADFMAPEEKKSCSIKLLSLSKLPEEMHINYRREEEKMHQEEELQTCAMTWPDGYLATKAKFSIAQG